MLDSFSKGTETTESKITEKRKTTCYIQEGKIAEVIQQKSQLNVAEHSIIFAL